MPIADLFLLNKPIVENQMTLSIKHERFGKAPTNANLSTFWEFCSCVQNTTSITSIHVRVLFSGSIQQKRLLRSCSWRVNQPTWINGNMHKTWAFSRTVSILSQIEDLLDICSDLCSDSKFPPYHKKVWNAFSQLLFQECLLRTYCCWINQPPRTKWQNP